MAKRRVFRESVVQPQDQSYRLIPLTQCQNALVDASDYDWLMQWNWFASWSKNTKSFYAMRRIWINGRDKTIPMHRQILGLKLDDPRQGDHKEPGQTLNNRRSNLRIATQSQNQQNSNKQANNKSGFKGVSLRKDTNKWTAHICVNGKDRNLGYFEDRTEAARAYDAAALRCFGEFAHLNFPAS